MLKIACYRGFNTIMIQKLLRMSCILCRNQINLFKYPYCPEGDVLQVPDRGCYYIKGSIHCRHLIRRGKDNQQSMPAFLNASPESKRLPSRYPLCYIYSNADQGDTKALKPDKAIVHCPIALSDCRRNRDRDTFCKV